MFPQGNANRLCICFAVLASIVGDTRCSTDAMRRLISATVHHIRSPLAYFCVFSSSFCFGFQTVKIANEQENNISGVFALCSMYFASYIDSLSNNSTSDFLFLENWSQCKTPTRRHSVAFSGRWAARHSTRRYAWPNLSQCTTFQMIVITEKCFFVLGCRSKIRRSLTREGYN